MNCIEWVGRRLGLWLLGVAAFAAGSALLVPAASADEAAPAAHAVRLSSVDGQVQVLQDNQLLADQALVNTPLFEGSQVVTLDDGRAELQFEDGSVVRLSPGSSLTLKALGGPSGSGDVEIVMERGLGYFELQGEGTGSRILVRFGDSEVTASGFTVLRINLDRAPGDLAVFSGNAHLERASALALDLHGGESVALNGVDPSRYSLSESIEPDSWDSWNADRDQVLTAQAAARTGAASSLANSNNPAWNELDANGNWYNVPGVGTIWSPFEAAGSGWDPYGNGYWMWTPRFGYIWVSGDSWGYMPFQCGAWNYYSEFGWGWMPGMQMGMGMGIGMGMGMGMGMCQPWWGGGNGWYSNIGYMPPGYRFPRRPHPGPPRGRPIGGRGTYPIVAINRRPPAGTVGLPTRGRNTPVVIAGHVVQPMRPLPSRPTYDHQTAGFGSHPQPIYTVGRTPVTPGRGIGQTFGGNRPGYTPPPPTYGGGQHPYSPSHPSSGGGAAPGHSYGGGGSSGGSSSSHSGGGGSSSGGGGGGGGSHGGGGGGGSSSGSHH